MKNTKLSIGLIACLLSIGGLAGCEKRAKSSKDGVLLTYTVDGKDYSITADEILEKSYDDSSKYQAIYDIIYSVLVKNYFNYSNKVEYYYGEQPAIGKGQMDDIRDKAEKKRKDDEDTARQNAENNNTKYKKELETILDSKEVKTVEELEEKYVEELQKETFEKNFYTYYIEDIKQGAGTTRLVGQSEEEAKQAAKDAGLDTYWTGYFKDQAPYHVSHILVKLEDGSGTNYSTGTISQANAKKLYDVVKALGEGKDDFDTISRYSEDTGSRDMHGDLGIMDTSTSFVNEFKLGVYAYENYYGNESEETLKASKIDASSFKTKYEQAVLDSFHETHLVAGNIPTIDESVFATLNSVREVEKDETHESVLEDAKEFYPRNIIYNKYLNRHMVAFITGAVSTDVIDPITSEVVIPGLETAEKRNAAPNGRTGYVQYEGHSKLDPTLIGSKGILSVKVNGDWRPILCVRAGSDYQGVHFIVVNRSPFEVDEVEGKRVSQSEYYTTFYPDQNLYPHTGSGDERVNKKTFVNFSIQDSDTTSTKKRAEEFISKLKSFDSDRLGKYIFRKYMAEEKVKINQEGIAKSFEKWIETSVEKAEEERSETWRKTWNEYIDTLLKQGDERKKLIPEACRLVYNIANEAVKLETALPWASLTEDQKDEVASLFPGADLAAKKTAAEAYWKDDDTLVSSEFKTKKGICNDGKDHL